MKYWCNCCQKDVEQEAFTGVCNQCRDDAALGRAVLALPDCMGICSVIYPAGREWSVRDGDEAEIGCGLTPEEAIKAAGLWPDTPYRCTVCGRVGSVGRCCGDETRESV
jgi:hypothetical protein